EGRPTLMEQYERTRSIRPAGVVATACRQRGVVATREAPAVIASAVNWHLMRGRLGRVGGRRGSERGGSRGKAGGEKRRRLEGNARSDEDGGIGVESINPRKCSEVADGVARQSEGSAQLSLLCAVRQGVSHGRSSFCLRMLQSQWWSGRS